MGSAWGTGGWGVGPYSHTAGTAAVYSMAARIVVAFAVKPAPIRITAGLAVISIVLSVRGVAALIMAPAASSAVRFAVNAAAVLTMTGNAAAVAVRFSVAGELVATWTETAPCEAGAWIIAPAAAGEWAEATDCARGTWSVAA